MTLSVLSHKKQEGGLKLGLGSSPPLPLPAQTKALRQRAAPARPGLRITGCLGSSWAVDNTGGSCSPSRQGQECLFLTLLVWPRGSKSPPRDVDKKPPVLSSLPLPELWAQILPFSTSLSRLKSFC